jgi:hypothetical protein
MSRPFEYGPEWKDDSEPPFRSKSPEPIGAPAVDDPTFDVRRRQANLCEAVMQRVVELEEGAARMLEIAKKLRAAVVANT